MYRHIIALLAIILVLVMAIGIVTAQDDSNWCYEGQPWGDGRCNNDNPDVTHYYWVAGWCAAHIENGTFSGSMDDCLMNQGVVKAVNDIYKSSNDTISCRSVDHVGSGSGLLANDEGENLHITDYTQIKGHPGSELVVNQNGGFSYYVRWPGEYTFEYTVNGQSTATVTLVVCPHLFDKNSEGEIEGEGEPR